jgi:hypothetical protein
MATTTAPYSEPMIASLASSILDDRPVASLSDDTTVARFMARWFGPARDALLQKYPANFSKDRRVLAADGVRPAFGWDYSYTIPTDWVCVLPLTERGEWGARELVYAVESGKILTNEKAPLYVRGIKRVTNPAKFPPLFATLLAARLAVLGSLNITGKSSYFEKASSLYQQALEDFRLSDTLESGTPEPQDRHDIIDVRGVGI